MSVDYEYSSNWILVVTFVKRMSIWTIEATLQIGRNNNNILEDGKV